MPTRSPRVISCWWIAPTKPDRAGSWCRDDVLHTCCRRTEVQKGAVAAAAQPQRPRPMWGLGGYVGVSLNTLPIFTYPSPLFSKRAKGNPHKLQQPLHRELSSVQRGRSHVNHDLRWGTLSTYLGRKAQRTGKGWYGC